MSFLEAPGNRLHPQTNQLEEELGNANTTGRYDIAYYIISAIFFTYYFIGAAYQHRDNIPQLFLIVATYGDFILLFWVGREFQNTPLDKVDKRNRLKVAGWVAVSTLLFLLPYQLPTVLPLPFQVVVCVFALTFYFVIFLLCFVLPGDASTTTRAVRSIAPLPPAAPEVEMIHVQSMV